MTDINEGLPPNDLRLFLRTISMATPEQVILLCRESADHIDTLEASNKSLVEALEKVLVEYDKLDNFEPAPMALAYFAAMDAIAVAKEAT